MVRIAIAGGSGELGREVTDALVATGKHSIVVLTRIALPSADANTNITYRTVDYDDHDTLVQALQGIHTVLSFINQSMEPPEKNAQKSLIDACISAGVARFAPSEYGSVGKDDLPFWSKKKTIQTYLEQVNQNGKVLEYTLFQPGLFLDYLASPFRTTKYVTPLDTFFNFQDRRAIIVEGHEDAVVTFTTVKDIVGIVVRAVEDPREWPRDGGVRGNRVSVVDVIRVGERVRGTQFAVEKVRMQDLEAGKLTTSWSLDKRHPGFAGDEAGELEAALKMVLIATLLSAAKGAWDVSDAWNQRFPDHQFVGIEKFLEEVWKDKS